MTAIPRPEHPRPQFVRDTWINLNGSDWTFRFDHGRSGHEAGWQHSTGFADRITVPFCPESELSGVGHTDFILGMWYHRALAIPADWAGQRVLLHFGAADYEAEVYVDGRSVGLHFGGTVGFACDITDRVEAGRTHHLVVRVWDDTRHNAQPGGKQCPNLKSRGCHYTRTTGIWQTVWLEALHPHGLGSVRTTPDVDGARLVFTPRTHASKHGLRFRATIADGPSVTAPLSDGVPVALDLPGPRLWSPDDPHLYRLTFDVLDGGSVIDTVQSYAGLRKVHVEGNRVYLNNKPIFQRLVLDQGFYPDGIWTAPTDDALRRDIEMSMAAGFNGARLHQKVFEERFHYWADTLGYLTWGESSSWGIKAWDDKGMRHFMPEWEAVVERDVNHPSIIAWTPLNESWHDNSAAHRRGVIDLYDRTKALDPTRPVNTTSGGNWYRHDLTTIHDYCQDPTEFAGHLEPPYARGNHTNSTWAVDHGLIAGPLLMDEYGGIKWFPRDQDSADRAKSWGYGNAPKSEEEFFTRLRGLTRALVENDDWSGYCYTQLTDVEQEQNGVYFYDRSNKFDVSKFHAIFSMKPGWSAY